MCEIPTECSAHKSQSPGLTVGAVWRTHNKFIGAHKNVLISFKIRW